MNAPGECILEKNCVLLETKMNQDGWSLSIAKKNPKCPRAALFCWLRSAVNQTDFHFGSNVDAEQEVSFTLNMLRSYILQFFKIFYMAVRSRHVGVFFFFAETAG